MKKLLATIIILLSLFCSYEPASAIGATIYVATNGSDANIGTSQAPFRTINKAVSIALAGDTIRVRPGNYTEHIMIQNKHGSQTAPITIMGEGNDVNSYPTIDGRDPTFINSTGTDQPGFYLLNSSWISISKFNIRNASQSSVRIENSHYITLRHLKILANGNCVLANGKSSHILMEYNDISQNYPAGSTWTDLKGSKWEGGGYTSYGAAGMVTIRNNYIHNFMNGIVLYSNTRLGNYYDANVWVSRNRFENIVDDAFEPESFAFNTHFYENTLINTHRMASFAPGRLGLGPVYVYANMQYFDRDPTGEAHEGRKNSAMKIDLPLNYYPRGIVVFNNSMDARAEVTNSYGDHILNTTVSNFTQKNNIFLSVNPMISSPTLTLLNGSIFTSDMSQTSLGYNEPVGYANSDPLFKDTSLEDLRPLSASPARGKSLAITNLEGFASSQIVPAGADLGAFSYSRNDFHDMPDPIYLVPPGGEDPSFPPNASLPPDLEGGFIPKSGPKWQDLQGDTDNDGDVDIFDYNRLIMDFNLTSSPADFNSSGRVDMVDYNILLANFGN